MNPAFREQDIHTPFTTPTASTLIGYLRGSGPCSCKLSQWPKKKRLQLCSTEPGGKGGHLLYSYGIHKPKSEQSMICQKPWVTISGYSAYQLLSSKTLKLPAVDKEYMVWSLACSPVCRQYQRPIREHCWPLNRCGGQSVLISGALCPALGLNLTYCFRFYLEMGNLLVTKLHSNQIFVPDLVGTSYQLLS